MERVLLAELRMLADIYGANSAAGRAMVAATELDDPRMYRWGMWLLVYEAGAAEDTVVIRRFW